MATGNYSLGIDWFAPNSIEVSSFEGFGDLALEGWAAFGTTPPSVALSTAQHYSGDQSLQITWPSYNPMQFDVAGTGFGQGKFGVDAANNSLSAFKFDIAGHGFDQGTFGTIDDTSIYAPVVGYVAKDYNALTIGQTYNVSAFVQLSASQTGLQLGISGMVTSGNTATALGASWQELDLTFTATATSHTLTLNPLANPVDSDVAYLDYISIDTGSNDVTADFLSRSSVNWEYGRDWTASLTTPMMTSQINLELLNTSGRYMPTNTGSPLYGYIGPGKEVQLSATFNDQGAGLGLGAQNYPLFTGFIDDFQVNASTPSQSVALTAIDTIGKLNEKKLSTELHFSIQSGDAINFILDAINWPTEKRDIDQGSTTFRLWWLDDTNANQAIQDVVKSEGDPAIFYFNPSGVAVFRDRHHRIPTPGAVGFIVNADSQ